MRIFGHFVNVLSCPGSYLRMVRESKKDGGNNGSKGDPMVENCKNEDLGREGNGLREDSLVLSP